MTSVLTLAWIMATTQMAHGSMLAYSVEPGKLHPAMGLAGVPQRHGLPVRRDVVGRLHHVAAPGQHLAVLDQHPAEGVVSHLNRRRCLLQGHLHVSFVLTFLCHLSPFETSSFL